MSVYKRLFDRDFWFNIGFVIICTLLTIVVPRLTYQAFNDFGIWTALSYWLAHGFQWSVEVEINVGPLGFLSYPQLYTGYFEGLKLISQVGLALVFSILLLRSMRAIDIPLVKWFYAFFAILFVHLDVEVLSHFLVFLIALELILKAKGILRPICIVVLAILALGKGFYLFLDIMIVLASAAVCIFRKQIKSAIFEVGLFAFVFVALWKISGQSIANIPEFFIYTKNASDSYMDVSAQDETWEMFVHGIAVLVLLFFAALYQFTNLLQKHSYKIVLTALLVEAAITFATFKHGFVLPGGHIDIYFAFCVLISFPILWEARDQKIYPLTDKSVYLSIWLNPFVVSLFIYPICLFLFDSLRLNFFKLEIGDPKKGWELTTSLYPAILFALLCCAPYVFARSKSALVTHRMEKWKWALAACQFFLFGISLTELPNWRFYLDFLHTKSIPAILLTEGWDNYFSGLKKKTEDARVAMRLPEIRAKVGNETITSYMPFIGPLIFDNYNFTSTPSALSYVSLDSRLIKKDAAYFRDDKSAPSYILYGLNGVGTRLPSQDGSLAQMEIFHKYRPIFFEAGYYLMERQKKNLPPLEWQSLSGGGRYKMESDITVPQMQDPLWIKTKIKESLVYRLVRFLYKPPFYQITLTTAKGRILVNKYTPRVGEIGFLLNPIIFNNSDMVNAYSKEEYGKYLANQESELDQVVSFKIECVTRKFACADYLDVQYEKISNLGFGEINKNDIKKAQSILSYLGDISLGDGTGVVREKFADKDKNGAAYALSNPWKLFVHPGRTTPTNFTYNCKGPCNRVAVSAEIDRDLPPNISSKSARVNLIIKDQMGMILGKYYIDRFNRQPRLLFVLPGDTHLYFSVDNNGDPDTDWLSLSIQNE